MPSLENPVPLFARQSAIGAVVKVRVGDAVRTQQVMPTRSYLSCSELPLTFGLGKLDHVDSVEIRWPGGDTQKLDSVRTDALTVIEQPRSF